jgi:predicted O-linked N-acetylglucosamine transferase (SPINDLY family)
MDDFAAARRIARDGIDVLVDLMSHSRSARPGILLHKPAPLIVGHLGLHGATGLRQVDFRITDEVADLPDAGRWQIESPLRMRGAVIPIRPVDESAKRGHAPARPAASVVFGAFVGLQKMSPRCLRAWRGIIDGTPDSILLFSLHQPWEQALIARRAASFGIDVSRLHFVPSSQQEPVERARYQIVDVALDAFPYTGGDSAAAALAEGVPFVTLCGRRHAERVATSILTHIGITDTIAHSDEEYVEIAVALGRDFAQRSALVKRIRAAVPPNLDASMDVYTRNLEEALGRAVTERARA